MRRRVYLGEWFINAGIVGFYRLLQRLDDQTLYTVKANYIEYDSRIWKEIPKLFFDELFDRFNKQPIDEKLISRYLQYAAKKEYFKDNCDAILDHMKSTVDKLKKAPLPDEVIASLIDIREKTKKIKKHQDYEELVRVSHDYLKWLAKDHVNEVLTLNQIRYILSQLYGQPSFLNASFKGRKKDFISKFEHDFIQPVIEEHAFMEWWESIPSGEQKAYLKQKKKEKGMGSYFSKIVNKLAKQDGVIPCQLQPNFPGVLPFEEMSFFPLGLSMKIINVAWQMEGKAWISYMSRFILFCASIGLVIHKQPVKELFYQSSKKERTFAFLNLEESIQTIYRQNAALDNRKDEENPFHELVYDLLSETKDISIWTLENILFVEFTNEGKNTKLHYYHIPKKVAAFFKSDSYLGQIKNKKFRNQMIQAILDRKDPIQWIGHYLRYCIKKGQDAYACCLALQSRFHLKQCLTEGGSPLSASKIKFFFYKGRELVEIYQNQKKENQLPGLSYRLLNACKSGNRQLFFDTLLRIFMSNEKEVPIEFLNVFHEEDYDFAEVGYAFISGLQSKSSEKRGVNNE